VVHIRAGVNVQRFLADARRLAADAAALSVGFTSSALLAPAPLGSLRMARADIFTGSRDHLLRLLHVGVSFATPRGPRSIALALALAQPNQPQAISAPSHAQPPARLAPALSRLGLLESAPG
jgi:hypothetical protein